MNLENNNSIIYSDGEIELNVSINNETTWINRNQISQLLDRDIKTIGKHINNIFKDKELDKNSVVANFATVQNEGGRDVTRDIEYYNLDVVISVGYRVKSQRGVKFRQWATSVLKKYIDNGYTLNSYKITNQRFKELESDVNVLKQQMTNISNKIEDKTLKPKQGIFYNGQVFDAHNFISDIIRDAKSSIKLIDNYVDDSVLTLFSKNQNIDITIYTKTISKQLRLDLDKYNAQYKNITIKNFKDSHDRFMIVDNVDVYHIGASLKDLGKKWFAFSLFDVGAFGLLGRLK